MAKLLAVDQEWNNFKSKFNKSYDSPDEEQKRYKIFQESYKKVAEHNKKFEAGEVGFSQGINQFSDLTEAEFSSQACGTKPGLKATGLRATGLGAPKPN